MPVPPGLFVLISVNSCLFVVAAFELAHSVPRLLNERKADYEPNQSQTSRTRFVEKDGRLLAGGQLPLGRPDLSVGQSALAAATETRAYQAAAAGPLGDDAGLEPHLC